MKRLSPKQAKRNRNLASMKPPLDGMCAKCHKRPYFPPLGKHHKVRRSDLGKDNTENLEWLCQPCHEKEYGEKSRQKRTAPDIKRGLAGFTGGLCAFSKATQLGRKE